MLQFFIIFYRIITGSIKVKSDAEQFYLPALQNSCKNEGLSSSMGQILQIFSKRIHVSALILKVLYVILTASG